MCRVRRNKSSNILILITNNAGYVLHCEMNKLIKIDKSNKKLIIQTQLYKHYTKFLLGKVPKKPKRNMKCTFFFACL